jgi:broad specificity phosphatase PhoE
MRVVTLIYLVQHGDKERAAGDPGLTALGTRQAAVTARWLQERGLRALYSSPLRRARETAAPVASATGLSVQLEIRLRERLNWDGSQTFDAFLADWAAPLAIATSCSATGNPHDRQGSECGPFSRG